jgi:hypothetical protein
VCPDQCREARTILKWTRRELADAAGVMLWVVAAFVLGRGRALKHTVHMSVLDGLEISRTILWTKA